MYLQIRDHRTHKVYYSMDFNNQNYIPPIPGPYDILVLHPDTPDTSKQVHVLYRRFEFDEIGLAGVTLDVALDMPIEDLKFTSTLGAARGDLSKKA